jgi:hypothetical protein
MTLRHLHRLGALARAIGGITAAPSVRAEMLIGLTTTNQLGTFDSATPWMTSTPMAISALAANEGILGIDLRPSTGVLYGLGSAGNPHTLDTATGNATFIAALVADPADASAPFAGLMGAAFGIDFNPIPDLGQTLPSLRVTSNAGINLRISVDTIGTVGFDISFGSGVYASLTDGLTGKSALHTIDLATGGASLIGAFGIGGDTALAPPLLGLAAPVPEPGTYALMLLGLLGISVVAPRRTA